MTFIELKPEVKNQKSSGYLHPPLFVAVNHLIRSWMAHSGESANASCHQVELKSINVDRESTATYKNMSEA